jgi:hypothetical protein
MKAADS